jgi:hypothetical protein
MIASRTRAFGIIVILAQSEFNLVSSPLYGVALKGHRRPWLDRAFAAMSCGPFALNAREPPGCPQRLTRCVAMWCDAQRRVVQRCDAPRRAALPTVMSISPTRLIDQANVAGREATSRQCCCRSRHLFRSRRKGRDCWDGM